MTLNELLTIAAIFLSPFFAVYIQSLIEINKNKKGRKEHIFKSLMATRATPLDANHVQALNMIDLEFSDKNKKEKKVLSAWKALMDHFGTEISQPNNEAEKSTYQTRLDNWNTQNTDKLIDVLYEMALCLGYDFDKVHLKRGVYYPRGHGQLDTEQRLLRQAALMFFMGDKAARIKVDSDENN